MAGFLNAQSGAGLLGGLERGLSQGMAIRRQREQNEAMMAYREAMLGAKAKKGQGDGMYFKDIDVNTAGTPIGEMFIPGERVPGVYYQGAQFAKPTAEEKTETGEALQVAGYGEQLAKQWQEAGFQAGTGKQAIGGAVERFLPGQVSQRLVGEKYKEFGDTKRIMSEVALRAATGASAPPSEVQTYSGFLPEPGDSPKIAVNKINNFYDRLIKKVEARALLMESQGLDKQAQGIRETVIKKFQESKTQAASAFTGKPIVSSDREAKLRRLQELEAKAAGAIPEPPTINPGLLNEPPPLPY